MKRVTKRRTGYLYRRGQVYYLEYMLNGQRVKQALRDAEGTPITDRKKAETKRIAIMSPLTVADRQDAKQIARAEFDAADSGHTEPAQVAGKEEEVVVALTIQDAWDTYVNSTQRPDSGPRTLTGYESQFRLFASWMGEKYPSCPEMRQVTSEIADQYASYLLHDDVYPKSLRSKKRKGMSNDEEKPTPKRAASSNTFNKHIRLLELVFRVLKKKAQLIDNPWSEIGKKTERKQSRRELTIGEINTIVNKAEGELKTLLLLGIYTGMRLGDCCTLRWSEVDRTRNIILRVPNKTARKGEPVHIPIHLTLAKVLFSKPTPKQGEYVMPGFARKYRQNNSDITKEMRDHFTDCSIRVHGEGTGKGTDKRAVVEVGFHSLRHSFVSLCRQANAPLAVVEAIVGHSNPAMTRHYTHVGELAAGQAVAALPAIGRQNTEGPRKSARAKLLSKRDQEFVAILENSSAVTWIKDRERLLGLILGK